MDELIRRITTEVGIGPDLARQATAIILSFLKSAGPQDEVAAVMAKIPGAEQAAAEAPDREGGGLFGSMGALAAMNELTAIGLDTSQVMAVTRSLVGFAKEKAGDEPVARILNAIPGLGQFA